VSRSGVAVRLADAMRRGALVDGSVDFLATDWFAIAALPLAEARERFGIVPKSSAAVAAGAVGPWEPGGISEFQHAQGRALADRAGVPYDPFGATAAP
jgi:hypothetical protein